MPSPHLPSEFEGPVQEFLKDHKSFLSTAEGKAVLKTIAQTKHQLFGQRDSPNGSLGDDGAATTITQWFDRLPAELVGHPDARLIDFKDLSKTKAAATFRHALQTLTAGAAALIGGGGGAEFDVRRILHGAFGRDPASEAIRKPFDEPGLPKPPFPPKGKMPDIGKLLVQGTLAKLFRGIAKCGFAAAENMAWANRIQPIGHIVSIEPPRGCAGDRVTVHYEGFGAAPPPGIAEIILTYPNTSGGCGRIIVVGIGSPGGLGPIAWRDSGCQFTS
jgi:hypothetical protein